MRALAILYVLFMGLGPAVAESELRLNQTRFGHATVIVDDSIYVFGGYGNDGFADRIERIPPDRSAVLAVGDFPHPRYWVNAATDGTHVYLVGGIGSMEDDDETNSKARVERWTPSTGEWKTLAPLPKPRAHVGLVWHAGKLYAVGGHAENGRVGRVDIYDPLSDTWTRGADMPTARETDVVLHEGRFYAAGGYDGVSSVAAFEVYDPNADTWMKLPDMPFVLSAHKAVVVDNVLYTFGHYHVRNRVTAYDFSTGEWSILDLPYKPARHTDAVFDGREVFVIGGNTRSGPPYLDTVQRFTREQLAAAPRRVPDEQIAKEDAAAKPWKPSPELQAILHAWTGALARIQTLDLKLIHSHRVAGRDLDHTQEMTFQFDRNGPRAHFDGMGTRTVLDGSNITISIERRRRYLQEPQPAPLDMNAEELKYTLGYLTPDLQALLAPNPIDHLLQLAKSLQWTVVKPSEDAQPGDWVIAGRLAFGEEEMPIRLIVNPETGLARSETKTYKMIYNRDGERATNVMTLTQSPDKISINEALPTDAFVFNTDQNWKRVDRVRALWGGPSSSGRFALSGKPAPDFSLKLLDGETFTLSAHTGKVVILDFWATWCGPCVKALPEMQKFWDEMRTQAVVVVGISTDDPDNEDAVRRMVKREKLTYPIGIDTDDIKEAYHVQGIPCIVLIDRNGIVQGRHVGFSSEMKKQLRDQTGKLLAGESLPSAEPPDYEEDEEEYDVPSRSARMDPRYFETIWETNTPQRARQVYYMSEFLQIRVPPSLLTIERDDTILAIRPHSGEVVASFAKPAGTNKSEAQQAQVLWTFLQRAEGEYLLARAVNMVERVKEGARTVNRHIGSEITVFDMQGNARWHHAQQQSIQLISAIPISEHEDLLVASDFTSFTLFNADGGRRAVQQVHFGNQVLIFDHDRDGMPDFHLIGPHSGAYRLR